MMGEAGPDAFGTEGAADVNVEAPLKAYCAKPSNPDYVFCS